MSTESANGQNGLTSEEDMKNIETIDGLDLTWAKSDSCEERHCKTWQEKCLKSCRDYRSPKAFSDDEQINYWSNSTYPNDFYSFPEEDPYSVPSDSSGSKSGKSSDGKSRPPRLPPRYVVGKKAPANLPKPDYGEYGIENQLHEQRGRRKSDKKLGNSFVANVLGY